MLRLHAFSGGKEEVYLVTNVLEESRLSSRQMREIYQARWGVEIYDRDFKQTFGRGKLLGKTAKNAASTRMHGVEWDPALRFAADEPGSTTAKPAPKPPVAVGS